MPPKDSLLIKIDQINAKVTALQDSTCKIKEYTDYQLESHEVHKTMMSEWGYLLAIVPLIIWLILQLFSFVKEQKKPKDLINEHTKNFGWVFVWLLSAGLVCYTMYLNGMIHTPKGGFMVSHLDMILAIASIIAIVGAVWAVYARIDAERAFKKSQETLDALGSTFSFVELLNKDKVSDIIDKIGDDGYDISLFLGFPYIGYLYVGKEKFLHKPSTTFNEFKTNIESLKNRIESSDNPIKNYKFSISLFTEHESLKLIDKYGAEQKLDPVEIANTKDEIKEFYKRIMLLKVKSNVTIDTNMGTNENLRFASIKALSKGSKFIDNKSYVWIVKDLNTPKVTFNSSAFQSSDTNLLSVLQTVFN